MNSIEEGHICRPQILRIMIFFSFLSFVGSNPTLKNYKGERCGPHILRLRIFFPLWEAIPHWKFTRERGLPFPIKGVLSPLIWEEGKRETISLLNQKKVGDPNGP